MVVQESTQTRVHSTGTENNSTPALYFHVTELL